MGLSDLLAGLNRSVENHLCDLYALTPASGGEERVLPAWIETPSAPPPGFGAPMPTPTVEVAAASHVLSRGDIFFRGRWVGPVFEKELTGWRVTGAAIRIGGGDWFSANVEPFKPG